MNKIVDNVRTRCPGPDADDAVVNICELLSGDIGCGLAGIAKGHTPVAVDDGIVLYHDPPGSGSDEDSRTAVPLRPLIFLKTLPL